MEKIIEWLALTLGGIVGWFVGKFSPAFPLIIIATLFVLYDAWSAYELDKRGGVALLEYLTTTSDELLLAMTQRLKEGNSDDDF